MTVARLARIARVTVRALHHYDEIGLLSPGGRTASGHRRYDEADLQRLQQLLFYRELGFGLDQVAERCSTTELDATREQLTRQHGLLEERAARLRAMADAVARTIQARRAGISLTPRRCSRCSQTSTPRRRRRGRGALGRTPRYRQSQARTTKYTKDDWVPAAGGGGRGEPAVCRGDGGRLLAPDSTEAMDVAEAHREQISRNFYDCGYDIHRGLARDVRRGRAVHRRRTKTSRPGWRGTCTTRSSPTPPAPSAVKPTGEYRTENPRTSP